MKLSIIIPAYNEEDSLQRTVSILFDHFSQTVEGFEILVVNNNSSDDTEAIARELSERFAHVRYVNTDAEPGYGVAVRTGLTHFRGDVAVISMADGSERPEDVERLYRAVESGAACGFGTRFTMGGKAVGYPKFKLFVNHLGNRLISFLTGFDYDDYTNGFKAYRRDVIEVMGPLEGTDFELTIEMSVKAVMSGAHIAIEPNYWVDREFGQSKFDVVCQSWRYLKALVPIIRKNSTMLQLVTYLMVGLISSGVYLASLTVAMELTRLSLFQSIVVAYFIGLVVSYVGTAKFVFGENMRGYSFAKFLAVVFTSFAINVVLAKLLAQIGFHYFLIGVVIVFAVSVFNFAFHRNWTFASPKL